jgi:hypothetical protein
VLAAGVSVVDRDRQVLGLGHDQLRAVEVQFTH